PRPCVLLGATQTARKSQRSKEPHRPRGENLRIRVGIAHLVWPALIQHFHGSVAVSIRQKVNKKRRAAERPVLLVGLLSDNVEPLIAQSGLDILDRRRPVSQKRHTLREKALGHIGRLCVALASSVLDGLSLSALIRKTGVSADSVGPHR